MDPSKYSSLKIKVAREAAYLLYQGIEKEYKQAKLKAAKILGVSFLPSNLEVATQLDRIAEEHEGKARGRNLVRMRKQALDLMETLQSYNPVLVGSVWRGTIHRDSDIDLVVYHKNSQDILNTIKQNNRKVLRTEWSTVTKNGLKQEYFHIYMDLPTNEEAEVIVRSPEEAEKEKTCEIYGDTISGLSLKPLKKLLEQDPTKRFVPF